VRNPNYNKDRHKARQIADPNYERKRYQMRLQRLLALPEIDRQEAIQKQNEYVNFWRSNYIKKLKLEDEVAYKKYRAAANAYFRRWYKQFRLKQKGEVVGDTH
jgi:hypothetical protein